MFAPEADACRAVKGGAAAPSAAGVRGDERLRGVAGAAVRPRWGRPGDPGRLQLRSRNRGTS